MKEKLLFLITFLFAPFAAIAQKKPTIMILPSDHWCEMRYFMTTYDNQGTKVKTPNYQQAFMEDTEIGPVISKIGQLLTDMGYSLKDAEQEIKSINTKTAEDNVTISKTNGATLVESPLDMLKRRIKCDVLIQISWDLSRLTGGHSTTFTLEAFDSYTNKRIATSTGSIQGQGSIVDLLFTAVQKNVKPFDKQMDNWFADQKKNGREINLTVRCWDNWDSDLETEFDGEELTDCIQNWLKKNCVNSMFNLSDGTESFAQFEMVRIPLTDERGNSLDARGFATQLRKYLNKAPFNITCKVMQRGLGEAIVVLGEK
ncbi:MAG: hypothetical protein IJL54_05260 [Prevotella sp.]|nr:hypothetical protein [Prevotella sp.]